MGTTLQGRVALVTGSGRGIGRAIAERLAGAGATIALHDHTRKSAAEFGESASLDATASAFAQYGVPVGTFIADIGNGTEVAAMKDEITETLGTVDILVNCAGGDIARKGGKPDPNDCLGIAEEDVRAVLERNLIGTILMCQAFVPPMRARGNGSVINITSVAGLIPTSNGAIYAVAKAGIGHYTQCLAQEVSVDNVRVNAIAPGPTWTARFAATRKTNPDMTREDGLIRYGRPSDIADAVAFFAGDEARFITGQEIAVDGGSTIRRKIG